MFPALSTLMVFLPTNKLALCGYHQNFTWMLPKLAFFPHICTIKKVIYTGLIKSHHWRRSSVTLILAYLKRNILCCIKRPKMWINYFTVDNTEKSKAWPFFYCFNYNFAPDWHKSWIRLHNYFPEYFNSQPCVFIMPVFIWLILLTTSFPLHLCYK